jgi:hypothetical protein
MPLGRCYLPSSCSGRWSSDAAVGAKSSFRIGPTSVPTGCGATAARSWQRRTSITVSGAAAGRQPDSLAPRPTGPQPPCSPSCSATSLAFPPRPPWPNGADAQALIRDTMAKARDVAPAAPAAAQPPRLSRGHRVPRRTRAHLRARPSCLPWPGGPARHPLNTLAALAGTVLGHQVKATSASSPSPARIVAWRCGRPRKCRWPGPLV